MMHPDIVEIISSIDKSCAYVTMFTTGYQLPEKARDLRRAGLSTVMVSLESVHPEEHDRRKSYPGSFDRAILGVKAALKAGLITALSKVVYKEDMADDAAPLRAWFELARQLKVHAVLLFDAIPTGSLYTKEESALGRELQDRIISLSTEYNKKPRYPGILSYTHLKNPWRLGCSGGKSYFYMNPYGDIQPCDFMPMSAGNITEESLPMIWDRFNKDPEFQKTGLQGCRMQLREFRDKYHDALAHRTFPLK